MTSRAVSPVFAGREAELMALARAFGEAVGRLPLVLVVEDVHWADRPTRDLLSFLIRNLRTRRGAACGHLPLGVASRGEAAATAHRLHLFDTP